MQLKAQAGEGEVGVLEMEREVSNQRLSTKGVKLPSALFGGRTGRV